MPEDDDGRPVGTQVDAMPLAPHTRLGPYQILAPLGAGGMGEVYRARDTRLDREVALKVLPGDVVAERAAVQRLLREARAAAALQHPSICVIHEAGEADGRPFIAMELLRGRSLREVLAASRPDPDTVLEGCIQIADALETAHRAGLVHRDVKPENIFVTERGEWKILDFGVAKRMPAADTDPALTRSMTLTEPGVAVGTVRYMAPEQALGRAVDARTDLFALGAVLYEALTGREASPGATAAEAFDAILNRVPTPPSQLARGVPPELDRAVLRALEKDPALRHQSAADLRSDLLRLRRDSASSRLPEREAARRRGRSLLRPAVLLPAALAIAAAVALWAGPRLGPSGSGGPAGTPSILVLPLEVRPPGEGAEYAGLAFSESVAMSLAQAESLQVLPVPRPEQVEGDTERQIGAARRARAQRLLTGSLTRNAGRVEARLVLLDTGSRRMLWGDREEAAAADLDILAESLARKVRSALRLGAPKRYEYFMYYTGGPELASTPEMVGIMAATRNLDGRQALTLVQLLLERFPNHAELHVLKCMALLELGWNLPADAAEVVRFRHALEALRRVDPSNPWHDSFHALRQTRDGHLAEAVSEFDRVLGRTDLTPAARANVLSLRGQARAALGDDAGAMADVEEALRLNPADDLNYVFAAGQLLNAGKRDEALVRARQSVAINANSHQNHELLGTTLLALERWEEAAAAFRRAGELVARQEYAALQAYALLRGGRVDEARRAAERATALADSEWGLVHLARYWARAGERARAIEALRRQVVQEGTAWQVGDDHQDFASLRGHPGYEALRAGAGRHR